MSGSGSPSRAGTCCLNAVQALHSPSHHTQLLATPKHSKHASSCLHSLAHVVSSAWWGSPFTALKGPVPRHLPANLLTHPPLSSEDLAHLSDFFPSARFEIQEGLGLSKSVGVPDTQDNTWHLVGTAQCWPNSLTPKPTIPTGDVASEQGLGHISVSLEVLNVVQDV